jgi:hypothetical protein
MNLSRPLRSSLLVLAFQPLAACTSVPIGSPEEDFRAKSHAISPDKSVIYLYRHETLGFAAHMSVSFNGRAAGKTVGQTYLMWEVDPGEHNITSHAENVAGVQVRAEAGKAYYVWQEVKVGVWSARSLLHEVDEQTGRTGVAECRMAKPVE